MPRRTWLTALREKKKHHGEKKHVDAGSRLGGFCCGVCGLRHPKQSDAVACCETLRALDASGKSSDDFVLRWQSSNGKRRAMKCSPEQVLFFTTYARASTPSFPELIIEFLKEADGDCRCVYRKYAAPLGISTQRWGGWINSLRARGYIKSELRLKSNDLPALT